MAEAYKEASAEMEKHFQVVAKRIGKKWIWLGRTLQVDNSSIECIDMDYKSTEEKAFQVLMRWYGAKGRAVATKEALVRALIDNEKKSIAEVLSPGDVGPAADNGNIEKPEKPSNSDGNRTSPVHKCPLHPQNGYNQVSAKIDKGLDGMIEDCIENLKTSREDCTAMIQNLKVAQKVQAMNTTLLESTLHHYDHDTDETAISIKEIIRTRKHRRQRIHQVIKATYEALNQGATNRRSGKTRPVSDVPRRVTSVYVAHFQKRSATYSPGTTPQISSPILAIQHQVLDRTREETEESDDIFVEKLNIPPRCKSCGGCMCFEIERSHSETSSSKWT